QVRASSGEFRLPDRASTRSIPSAARRWDALCARAVSSQRKLRTVPDSAPCRLLPAPPSLPRFLQSAHSDRRDAGSTSRSWPHPSRSEEHTSELQSRGHLVCRLLLEKKKKKQITLTT